MTISTRPPHKSECVEITDLVFASKASHGYSDAFMEACREELRVTPETLQKGPAIIAVDDERYIIVGFAQIVRINDDVWEVEALFISPEAQGLGIGRKLFEWAVGAASQEPSRILRINSDPGAEAFYERLGAVKVGETLSGSIEGRFLPQLEYALV